MVFRDAATIVIRTERDGLLGCCNHSHKNGKGWSSFLWQCYYWKRQKFSQKISIFWTNRKGSPEDYQGLVVKWNYVAFLSFHSHQPNSLKRVILFFCFTNFAQTNLFIHLITKICFRGWAYQKFRGYNLLRMTKL